MFKIKKRSGAVTDYNPEKISYTVELTAGETGVPLNHSDIENIKSLVTERLEAKGRDPISTEEVYIELCGVLVDLGMKKVARAYSQYVNNFYKDSVTLPE
ncbi:MAG: hypothetical protein LBT88_05380 [Oscillospiraceae bacterium]|jgi:transcriptional regulator NrdR family protein|nr:hypothetical protein [Oscillospiraceae bacterium]